MASNPPSAAKLAKLRPEIQTAKSCYIWLWFSPIFTFPTWAFLVLIIDLATGAPDLTATIVVLPVLGSACWHLLLLIPALAGKSEFIRWHGRQALLLACLRTVVMLAIMLMGWLFPLWESNFIVLGGLFLLAIWVSGNVWGQGQAGRGDCWLMRKAGRDAGLPVILVASPLAAASDGSQALPDNPDYVDSLVEIIRFDSDPDKRHAALVELEHLGFVDRLS